MAESIENLSNYNARRYKDVQMTKNSIGYTRYIHAIPKKNRIAQLCNTWCPKTPVPHKSISWSIWNKKLRCWRKLIHNWTRFDEKSYNDILKNPSLLWKLPPVSEQSKECVVDLSFAENNNLNEDFLNFPSDSHNKKISSKDLAESMIFPKLSKTIEKIARLPKEYLLPSQIETLKLQNISHPLPTFFVPEHYVGNAQLPSVNVLHERDLKNFIQDSKKNLDPTMERICSYAGERESIIFSEQFKQIFGFQECNLLFYPSKLFLESPENNARGDLESNSLPECPFMDSRSFLCKKKDENETEILKTLPHSNLYSRNNLEFSKNLNVLAFLEYRKEQRVEALKLLHQNKGTALNAEKGNNPEVYPRYSIKRRRFV